MSYADPVPDTEARQILANQEKILARLDQLTEAVNTSGALTQWIVDNVKGIFEMFGNPQMMSMMTGMAGGMMPNLTGAPGDGFPKE